MEDNEINPIGDKMVTIAMPLESEMYIKAIMDVMGFDEFSRHVTGGQMSDITIVITYFGCTERFTVRYYVVVDQINSDLKKYYSINHPYGKACKSVEAFKAQNMIAAHNFNLGILPE